MKYAWILILIGTAATVSCGQPTQADRARMHALGVAAMAGDLKAAREGYDVCSSEAKLENRLDATALFTECGGFRALIIENAIMTGDHAELARSIETMKMKSKYPLRAKYYEKQLNPAPAQAAPAIR